MAMISKSAKQPKEGMASASAPSASATGSYGKRGKQVNYVTDMQATKVMGNFRTPETSGGPKSHSVNKRVTVASEDVTRGMGGKVIKDMQ
jgi:hypothetical protein